MCALVRLIYKQCHQNTVFLIAVCLGMSLSIIVSPYLDDDCFFSNKEFASEHLSRSRSLSSDQIGDEYEPRINLDGKPKRAQKTPQVLNRPRYYTTELGIRQKLFIGVLTSMDSIATRGVALNKTVTHHVDKIVFFNDAPGPQKLNLSGVVGFTDTRKILKPFHVLKYISDNYLDKYDYFFIVRDTSYIKALSIYDMIKTISVSEDVHMGGWKKDEHSAFCSLDGGLLLSSSVLQKVAAGLGWCVKNAFSEADDDNVGRCIVHASNIHCDSTVQGQTLKSYRLEDYFNVDRDLETLPTNAQIIFPVKDATTIYKMHIHFCEAELNGAKHRVDELRDSILDMAPVAPGGVAAIAWPVGSQDSVKPGNRFDVLQWDFFTTNQLFPESDFGSVKQLTGADKLDIEYILNSSISAMEEKYEDKLQFRRLVNGYRRYDPARGMDYLLDLAFRDMDSGLEVLKRVAVAKLLGQVEFVPSPYVTENSRVHLILPIEASQVEQTAQFLREYASICETSKVSALVCSEQREKLFLLLVLLYDPLAPGKGDKNDVFGNLKSQALALSDRRKREGMHVAWLSIKTRGPRPSEISLMDLASRKLPQESLVLLCTPNMNLKPDFLNRVRINTVLRWQVFSPIPFSEYHPDIVYQDSERPNELDINKGYGHFDVNSAKHISFYLKDYMAARRKVEQQMPIIKADRDLPAPSSSQPYSSIYSLFVQKMEEIHVLRAVEPFLRLWYDDTRCEPNLDVELFQACQGAKAKGMGSRAHLASLILQYVQSKTL